MDIRCVKCSEPWDMDMIHDEISERYPDKPWEIEGKYVQSAYDPYYDEVKKDFFKRGCKTFGSTCNESGKRSPEWQVAYEVFGDDLDGIASIMDDMRY